MKVASFGLTIDAGKYKYSCEYFNKLVKKFSPKKTVYYSIEFIGGDLAKADAIVFNIKKKFDFIFMDIERIEGRISRCNDENEKNILSKLQDLLEKEELLCDHEFSPEEREVLKNLELATYKPALGILPGEEMDQLIGDILKKGGIILFFTVGRKEVHAWDIKKGSTIVAAAGRIHSDLARGFINADVVNCDILDKFFNLAEAKAKGFVKTVGKDYTVRDGDIIEVKFSV